MTSARCRYNHSCRPYHFPIHEGSRIPKIRPPSVLASVVILVLFSHYRLRIPLHSISPFSMSTFSLYPSIPASVMFLFPGIHTLYDSLAPLVRMVYVLSTSAFLPIHRHFDIFQPPVCFLFFYPYNTMLFSFLRRVDPFISSFSISPFMYSETMFILGFLFFSPSSKL